MKTVTTEKITKETITKYEAFDGNIFDSADECKTYENTAYAVIKKEYLKYQTNKFTEYEFYGHNAGCEEYDIAVVDIKDKAALEAINRFIYISMGNNAPIIDEKYIGKKIAMALGYEWGAKHEYDGVGYVYGTIEEILEYRKKTLEDLFNPTDENIEKVVNALCS